MQEYLFSHRSSRPTCATLSTSFVVLGVSCLLSVCPVGDWALPHLGPLQGWWPLSLTLRTPGCDPWVPGDVGTRVLYGEVGGWCLPRKSDCTPRYTSDPSRRPVRARLRIHGPQGSVCTFRSKGAYGDPFPGVGVGPEVARSGLFRVTGPRNRTMGSVRTRDPLTVGTWRDPTPRAFIVYPGDQCDEASAARTSGVRGLPHFSNSWFRSEVVSLRRSGFSLVWQKVLPGTGSMKNDPSRRAGPCGRWGRGGSENRPSSRREGTLSRGSSSSRW